MRVSHFVRAIYDKLYYLHSMSRNFVPTLNVAAHLGKNDRTVREVLVELEQHGAVLRKGQRGGWKPLVAPADLVATVRAAVKAREAVPMRQPPLIAYVNGAPASLLDLVDYVERPARKSRPLRQGILLYNIQMPAIQGAA